ncbi:MAG: SRPBCC family protein [Pseudomonadota bacterium]
MIQTFLLVALAAIALLLALLLAVAATRPDSFRIQRTAVIKAPAARIFALINDLRSFNNWNPWERKEPGIKGSYSGAPSGVGAAYAWEGRKVGSGRMEIVAAQAPNALTLQLDFLKPFKARNTAEFTLQAQGEGLTIVTWAMHGPSPYLSKLMGVLINMDSMIGKDFEAGLANLKALTEGRVSTASLHA